MVRSCLTITWLTFFSTLPVSLPAQLQPHYVQVSIPVFFQETKNISLPYQSLPPLGELSGIAFLMLEEEEKENKILLTDDESPLVWVDHLGVSKKVTFFLPDKDTVSRLEMLYSNATVSVACWVQDAKLANGSLFFDENRYVIQLAGSFEDVPKVKKILWLANHYLMTLYGQDHREILLKPAFRPDTLNVVVGQDRQFGSDNDVVWFDQGLYHRVGQLASNSCTSLLENDRPNLREALDKQGKVVHSIEKKAGRKKEYHGRVSVYFFKKRRLPAAASWTRLCCYG